jgi:hypothetical protein
MSGAGLTASAFHTLGGGEKTSTPVVSSGTAVSTPAVVGVPSSKSAPERVVSTSTTTSGSKTTATPTTGGGGVVVPEKITPKEKPSTIVPSSSIGTSLPSQVSTTSTSEQKASPSAITPSAPEQKVSVPTITPSIPEVRAEPQLKAPSEVLTTGGGGAMIGGGGMPTPPSPTAPITPPSPTEVSTLIPSEAIIPPTPLAIEQQASRPLSDVLRQLIREEGARLIEYPMPEPLEARARIARPSTIEEILERILSRQ